MDNKNTKQQAVDPRLASLTTLLQLEKSARHAENRSDLKFLFANETYRLIPYQQAVFWTFSDSGKLTVQAASNVSVVEKNSPYIQYVTKLLEYQVDQETARDVVVLDETMVSKSLEAQWQEWLPKSVVYFPFISPKGELVGGFCFSIEQWNEAYEALFERLADAYVHAWLALSSGPSMTDLFKDWFSRKKLSLLAVLFLVMIFPVRQSVIAPAKVVAKSPEVVTASIDGIIKEIAVKPNQAVKKGDLLFSMDSTEAQGQLNVARQTLEVSRADYLKNAQQAFSCHSCKAKLPRLKSMINQRDAEVAYYEALLARSQVYAKKSGVVIFDDVNDWLGHPVRVGQRVMLVSEEKDTWLEIELGIDDAIDLEAGSDVSLFLNINPLNVYSAKVIQTSYEPTLIGPSQLVYRIKAEFSVNEDKPRIGLKGTAKLYSDHVIFAYYLMRRPLSWLRRTLGW